MSPRQRSRGGMVSPTGRHQCANGAAPCRPIRHLIRHLTLRGRAPERSLRARAQIRRRIRSDARSSSDAYERWPQRLFRAGARGKGIERLFPQSQQTAGHLRPIERLGKPKNQFCESFHVRVAPASLVPFPDSTPPSGRRPVALNYRRTCAGCGEAVNLKGGKIRGKRFWGACCL